MPADSPYIGDEDPICRGWMLHLLKLAVGITDIEQFSTRIAARRAAGTVSAIQTRNLPKRAADVLDGGSLYWVVTGIVAARQPITDILADTRADGSKCARIELASELIRVVPRAMRAFQGWRYLEAEAAPADLDAAGAGLDLGDMPPRLRRALVEHCLI